MPDERDDETTDNGDQEGSRTLEKKSITGQGITHTIIQPLKHSGAG
ncbi:hypothetical protein ACFXG6_14970 [Streptomyces roseus]